MIKYRSSHSTGVGKYLIFLLWPIGISERLYAPVAQLDRALACGAKGRTFESCRVYQNYYGEVQEWLNWPLSKSGMAFGHRGFESLSLRQTLQLEG